MDQMPSNTPVMESKPGPAGWLPVWIKAVSQPYEQTFVDITEHPDAQSKTAYIWIFLAAMLIYLVSFIVQVIIMALGIGGQDSGVGGLGASLLIFICISPFVGALSVLFFALNVAIVQWIAKLFGGTGTYEKLVYAVAAIYVPITLASLILSPFYAIPFLNICVGMVAVGLSFYYLFLHITAVKAVNHFGWGQAIGSVLIPFVVIVVFCACVTIGVLMVLGPVIGNVFSEINQSLAP